MVPKSEWQKLKEESPEKVKRPMRCMLFSCLLKEMTDRLTLLRADKERRESMEKLGWLQQDEFQRLRWDAKLKKNAKVKALQPLLPALHRPLVWLTLVGGTRLDGGG